MANQQVDIYQQNMLARMNLLQTGISMIKRLQPVTADLGSQIRISLPRSGIMTGILLQFTVPVTIATAPAVPSPVAPWNIAQMVSYLDFAGVAHTRTNGFQLWAANSMKNNDAVSCIPAQNFAGGAGPSLNSFTNIINQPTAVGSGNIVFSLYVPLAYNPDSDLTGAVMCQTAVGEHYVNIQLANSLVNADPWIAPYISGAVTPSGATGQQVKVEAFQYYIQPQDTMNTMLPWIDLGTIYGYEGGVANTANITSGNQVYTNYPNNRSVYSALFNYENGSAFTANGADVNQIVLLANGNTNLREVTPRLMAETQRNLGNFDLPGGSYYFGSRRQPITTQLYANVQARFDLGTVNAGVTQIIQQFEVMYASGVPLPGQVVTA